ASRPALSHSAKPEYCRPRQIVRVLPVAPVGLGTYNSPLLCELRTEFNADQRLKQPLALLTLMQTPDQVPLCSSMLRIWPMARVGFRPLGQTCTQFMMPRQRNTLKGSSMAARRLSV